MQTRAFKSGNSLAVRIPKDLAIFEPSQNLIVERKGDTLVLRAVERKSLEHVMDIFASFSPGFMADGRGEPDWLETPERDWRGQSASRVQQGQEASIDRVAPKVPMAKQSTKKSGVISEKRTASNQQKKA